MRSDVKSELQMLREFFWLHGSQTLCCFCNLPLVGLPQNMTFGHRRHGRVPICFTAHHEDENRDNNAYTNLKDSHPWCHKQHHAEERKKRAQEEEVQVQEGKAPEGLLTGDEEA